MKTGRNKVEPLQDGTISEQEERQEQKQKKEQEQQQKLEQNLDNEQAFKAEKSIYGSNFPPLSNVSDITQSLQDINKSNEKLEYDLYRQQEEYQYQHQEEILTIIEEGKEIEKKEEKEKGKEETSRFVIGHRQETNIDSGGDYIEAHTQQDEDALISSPPLIPINPRRKPSLLVPNELVLPPGDALDRMWKLQRDLDGDNFIANYELLKMEVMFVLKVMISYLYDGILQVVALNTLFKCISRLPALGNILLANKGAAIFGQVIERHQGNDLLQDAIQQLLNILLNKSERKDTDGELIENKNKQKNNKAMGFVNQHNITTIREPYLPYVMSRMNTNYVKMLLEQQEGRGQEKEPKNGQEKEEEEQGQEQALGQQQYSEYLLSSKSRKIEALEAGATSAVAACAVVEYDQQNASSAIQQNLSPIRKATKKKNSSKINPLLKFRSPSPKKKKSKLKQGGDLIVSSTSSSKYGSNPVYSTRHPTVVKIFQSHRSQAKRRKSKGSAMKLLLQLFQILDGENTGLLSADKFAKGLKCGGNGNLDEGEIAKLLYDFGINLESDLVDYEVFCTSGKLLAIKSMEAPHLPVRPWINRMKKAKQEGDPTWTGHVDWFKRRRAKTAIWLMRKGMRAKQLIRQRAVNVSFLKDFARRAFAITYLLNRGNGALKRQRAQDRARKYLQNKIIQIKKLKNKHAESYRYLCRRGRRAKDKVLPPPTKIISTVNYQRAFYIAFRRKEAANFLMTKGVYELNKLLKEIALEKTQKAAFLYLKRRGVLAIQRIEHLERHAEKQDATVLWLTEVAQKMITLMENQIIASKWLFARSQRAFLHLENKELTQQKLVAAAVNGIQTWISREDALAWLLGKTPKAFFISKDKSDAIEYFLSRADSTFAHWDRYVEAITFLKKRISRSKKVVSKHKEAYKYLMEVVHRKLEWGHRRNEARGWLLRKGKFAFEHQKYQRKKLIDLRRIVEDIKVEIDREYLVALYSKEISMVSKRLKKEDSARVNSFKSMLVEKINNSTTGDSALDKMRVEEEVFILLLEHAFDCYDIREEGEIDRLDFRFLVENLNLTNRFSKADFDNFYNMVDKDQSGTIDYSEFEEWFKYEYIKSNKSEKPPADILTKAALLPLQERAVLQVMKELRNGDIEENEEINMKSVNINTARIIANSLGITDTPNPGKGTGGLRLW